MLTDQLLLVRLIFERANTGPFIPHHNFIINVKNWNSQHDVHPVKVSEVKAKCTVWLMPCPNKGWGGFEISIIILVLQRRAPAPTPGRIKQCLSPK